MPLLDASSLPSATSPLPGRLSSWRNSPYLATVAAGLAAMLTYVCMYAFRKPFAAATFSGEQFAGLDYKAWLVMAQVLGYAASKFLGIRIVGQMRRARRWQPLLLLIGLAWLSLLAFALAPRPWNIVFLFCNGLPLGMVWSVVFSYLEGRRATELMGTLMASSLIFASGLTKTVGRLLLAAGVGDWWMPFLTGLVFVPPLLLSVALLERLPPPAAADQAARGQRVPMTAAERGAFLRRFWPGLALAIACYVALTVVRDFRDSFEAELFRELGFGGRAGLFVQIETPIAVLVLAVTASLMLVRDNLRSLLLIHGLMIGGVALAGLSTLAFRLGALPPLWWLGLVGLGLYLAYVPFNCAFYERLIATFHGAANVGFLMNLSDACGYVGSIAVIVLRETGGLELSWSRFFGGCVLALALFGGACLLASAAYFRDKLRREAAVSPT